MFENWHKTIFCLKIMRDESNSSKGYAFINFASFEASDAALEAMNGQYLCNRPITISYAFKKDAKGERHGTEAERFLAAQNPLPQADRPHQLFADAPPSQPMPAMAAAPTSMPPPVHLQPPMMGIPGMPGMMPPPMLGPGGIPTMPGMYPFGMGLPGMPPGPPSMHFPPGMPPMYSQFPGGLPPPPPPGAQQYQMVIYCF